MCNVKKSPRIFDGLFSLLKFINDVFLVVFEEHFVYVVRRHYHGDCTVFSLILSQNHCLIPLLVHKMLLQNYDEGVK